MKIIRLTTVSLLLALTAIASAQTTQVEVVSAKRHTLAVKYIEDNATTVNLVGTSIAPRVTGKADVEYKRGRAKVKVNVENLAHPQSLGAYYTTYVLWAVAPEGQAENLAELMARPKQEVEVTTSFQNFGLIVTAEPHSAVRLPSPVVLAENALRKGTDGTIQASRIDYSGDSGTLYAVNTSAGGSVNADYDTPSLVLGARRAVEIAQRAGAQRYADAELREAEVKLAALNELWPRNRKDEEKYSGTARDVMRLAEKARSLAGERSNQARLDAERRAARSNIAAAQSDADRARSEADQAKGEAARAKETAEAYRDAMTRAERDAAEATKRVEQAQTEADKAKAREELARVEAERARLQADEAKREAAAAQQRLYVSLSEILETRREARGLIVNLSDVLFDTGKATLKPGAREKLSKLAGILLAYPGRYRIEIEGHTDAVGSEEYNLKLSQDRAESVRDYVTQAGLASNRITATKGFGKSQPVATNDTAAGRQVNRRVEIIIADTDAQPKAGNQ